MRRAIGSCSTFSERVAKREHVTILDLACGAGSNLRGQALSLPARQSWRLVDYDPELLDAARAELIAWADQVVSLEPLTLLKADRRLESEFLRSDLSRFDERLSFLTSISLRPRPSSISFPDLDRGLLRDARRAGLTALRRSLLRRRGALGVAHIADDAILSAFFNHQSGDKGFGTAAGPRGAELLQAALEKSRLLGGDGVQSLASGAFRARVDRRTRRRLSDSRIGDGARSCRGR